MFFSRRRAAATLAAGGAGLLWGPGRAFAARPRPRLVILLISEQFRSDYLDRFANFFVSGGFRRLMEGGAWFPDCQLAASSFTCSGLASISTGAYPDLHGIIADTWYDRQQRKPVPAGLHDLQGTTLADEAAAQRRRVFGVGGELRHAELLAGRQPEVLFSMLTNGELAAHGISAPPPWFAAVREAHSPEKQRGAPWHALGASRSAPAMRTLVYDAAHPEEFLVLYRSSPYAQAAQFALLRELIVHEKAGQGAGCDVLAVVLESTALLGYEVGADSPLMREMVLHLDRQIETLLGVLDKAVGPRNYALCFTAAHGVVSAPDERGRCAITGEAVARTVSQALSALYDLRGAKNVYVERYVYPFLYLRLDTLRRSYIDLREARAQAGRAAMRVPGVAGYYTLDGESSHSGEWLRRLRNSFHAARSGDVMLMYEPRCVEDYGGQGVSYGSLYNYETQVPLIFYGFPFVEQVFDSAAQSIDIAPTLARAMGVAWPSSASGRVLGEALAAAAG